MPDELQASESVTGAAPQPPAAIPNGLAPEGARTRRDGWERMSLVAGWTAAIVIPVLLALAGYYFNLVLKNRESETKMIELAIGVLRVEPTGDDTEKALRNWAMDVIDKYSEVRLPAEVRSHLETRPLDTA